LAGKVLSERNIFSFYRWILLSLLAHLAIAALVLQQTTKASPKRPKPAPIIVFAVSKLSLTPVSAAQRLQAATAKTEIAEPEKLKPAAPPPRLQTTAPAAVQVKRPTRPPAPVSAPAVTQVPALAVKAADSAITSTDISAVLESVSARTARRELSEAEIAALSTRKPDPSTSSDSRRQRPAGKPGTGPAADVLETLPDGSQLVRVGKGCVLATPGADLRKDIHSMKIVGCGAGGRTEQDRIDAHFDEVMSTIGQHR
jgi:hypothetical protein